MAIDGVVDAHVNLVLPETPRVRLNRDELPPPRAAVLIKYRPDAAGKVPVNIPDVQRLVAGAIDRMTPQQVEVVTTAIAVPVDSSNIKMTQVGPVSVAASNKITLQALVGLLVMMVLGLAAALSFVIIRRR
jgi:type III secretory pathway lipoprotein EscJ